MHLLYADESGSIADPNQRYFVLAGVCVFETGTYWIEQELNDLVRKFQPEDTYSLELHANHMRVGKKQWRHHSVEQRRQAIADALMLSVVRRHPHQVRLFGIVLDKQKHQGQDIAFTAFEQLSSRFDMFLTRLFQTKKRRERGLLLFDKCSTEERMQALARDFRGTGHSYGKTRNYAEVPVFLDSRASRLIQLADLVCYALFRNFQYDDDTYFKVIEHCFDSEGGVQHGLYIR